MTRRKNKALKRGLFIKTANKTKKANGYVNPPRGGYRF